MACFFQITPFPCASVRLAREKTSRRLIQTQNKYLLFQRHVLFHIRAAANMAVRNRCLRRLASSTLPNPVILCQRPHPRCCARLDLPICPRLNVWNGIVEIMKSVHFFFLVEGRMGQMYQSKAQFPIPARIGRAREIELQFPAGSWLRKIGLPSSNQAFSSALEH